jgi:cytochrome c-type biogenesis protein CcmF
MNLIFGLVILTAGNVEIALSSFDETETTEVHISEKKEVLTVTASIKPFINLVWAGVAVMVIGFFVAVTRRLKESLVKS